MSKKLRRLLRIREVAKTQSRLVLADAMQRAAEATEKCKDLEDLAAEYSELHRSSTLIDTDSLRRFGQFYANLSKARHAQDLMRIDAGRNEQMARDRYQNAAIACEGLERVIQARETAHKDAENRRLERHKVPSKNKPVV